MDTAQTTQPQAQDAAARPKRFGPLVLALQVAALLAAVYATIVALAFAIPDGNDYAKASVFKHRLLASQTDRKIVLVGGSNMSFGLDSTVIAGQTGCPVVNMGMNGYFGVRFMMEEVKPYLRAGDIVVMAWEYDSFYKSPDGTDTDLLMVTKANPAALRFLSPSQLVAVAARYPYVGHQKALNVMNTMFWSSIRTARALAGAEPQQPEADPDAVSLEDVEGLSGFDQTTGDMVGHLGIVWPNDFEDGVDATNTPMDKDILPMMAAFSEEMRVRGVKVMISHTPVMESYYQRHRAELERLDAQIRSTPGLVVPRPASDFIFPESQHFDTVYHLNAEGRAIRSAMVASDITAAFGEHASCKTEQNPS